uniref:SKP1-like protein n=1 Tax=Panagrolaimus davidi TaxID=227884 RepID=A0A914QYE5_9BILA
MASENAEIKYKLISSDNKEFLVSEAVIKQNDVWLSFYENGGSPGPEIPIKDIDGKTLKKVVEFCEKFVKDSQYNSNETRECAALRNDIRIINFFKDIKSGFLLELVKAANYLDNKRLVDACLFNIHRNLDGLDIEGIRKSLHLENDFTEAEEKQFKQENSDFFLPHYLQMHMADFGHHHMNFLDHDDDPLDLNDGLNLPVNGYD